MTNLTYKIKTSHNDDYITIKSFNNLGHVMSDNGESYRIHDGATHSLVVENNSNDQANLALKFNNKVLCIGTDEADADKELKKWESHIAHVIDEGDAILERAQDKHLTIGAVKTILSLQQNHS